jgi:hypothetical protein
MAKGSGSAGRGRSGGKGSSGKGKGDDGWTRSVWDVRGPNDKPKPIKEAKARRPRSEKRNDAGGVAVNTDIMGYGRTITGEMRELQRKVRTAARERGYRDDDPIPGTSGLTIRNLRRNAGSRGAQEGQLRAALQALRSGRGGRGAMMRV